MNDIFSGVLKSLSNSSESKASSRGRNLTELDVRINSEYNRQLDLHIHSHTNHPNTDLLGLSDIRDMAEPQERVNLLSELEKRYKSRLPEKESETMFAENSDWLKRQIILIILGKSENDLPRNSVNLVVLKRVISNEFYHSLSTSKFNEAVKVIRNYIKDGGTDNIN